VNPNPAEAGPRLVRTDAPRPAPAREADRRGGLPGLVWALAILLAFVLGAAVLQTGRLARMTERADRLAAKADGLQAELDGAQAQIRTYEMERDRVRESVADLAERVAALYQIVRPGSPAPSSPSEPARPTP